MKLRNKLDKKNLNSKKEKKQKPNSKVLNCNLSKLDTIITKLEKYKKKVKLDITKFQTRKQ